MTRALLSHKVHSKGEAKPIPNLISILHEISNILLQIYCYATIRVHLKKIVLDAFPIFKQNVSKYR
jgi:hypothetical protein